MQINVTGYRIKAINVVELIEQRGIYSEHFVLRDSSPS